MTWARLAFAAVLLASPAMAERAAFRFEWKGNGGYVMRGALAFDAALAGRMVVTQADLDCFEIEGLKDGQRIGRWALGMLTPGTSWILTFVPEIPAFVVYGPGAPMPQAWNMNGGGYDCGRGGFGFNIGNAAQDLCLDGQLLFPSQVIPERPFPAIRDDGYAFGADACTGPDLVG